MNQVAQLARDKGDIIENVVIRGDLSKLSQGERAEYYAAVCRSVGLNPLTVPFAYITLNGKLTLYALRACTDQLRSIHKVSVTDLSHAERDGVFIVTVKVQNGDGRSDMATGAVTIASLKGDALANALMKAETKAKRRATLSICGLGLLDESEVETIPNARTEAPAPVALAKPAPAEADPDTGEVGPRTLKVAEANGAKNWIGFGQALIAGVQASQTVAEIDQWSDLNESAVNAMEAEAPKAHVRMVKAIAAHRDGLAKVAEGEAEPLPF